MLGHNCTHWPHQVIFSNWEGVSLLAGTWVSPGHRLNTSKDSLRAFNYHFSSETQKPQMEAHAYNTDPHGVIQHPCTNLL